MLGFSCSGVSWVLLLLVLLSPCPAWQKSLYRPGSLSPSLAPSFPPSSLRPSLRIRIYYMLVEPAQSKCTWIPLFWQHNVGIDGCIFQFFSRPFFNDNQCLPKLPPGCQNTGEGSCNGRPFFNDKVGMPYLRRGCRIYVEGVVTRSTVSDAGVGGSGLFLVRHQGREGTNVQTNGCHSENLP